MSDAEGEAEVLGLTGTAGHFAAVGTDDEAVVHLRGEPEGDVGRNVADLGDGLAGLDENGDGLRVVLVVRLTAQHDDDVVLLGHEFTDIPEFTLTVLERGAGSFYDDFTKDLVSHNDTSFLCYVSFIKSCLSLFFINTLGPRSGLFEQIFARKKGQRQKALPMMLRLFDLDDRLGSLDALVVQAFSVMDSRSDIDGFAGFVGPGMAAGWPGGEPVGSYCFLIDLTGRSG